MLYFIRSGQYVKIGVSANPRGRIASIQTGNPDPIEVLGVVPGDRELEKELHREFAPLHHRGEWFRDDPAIHAASDRLAAPSVAPAVEWPWRIEFNRRRLQKGHIYHWVYRFGSGSKRKTVYGGMVESWMRPNDPRLAPSFLSVVATAAAPQEEPQP